MLEKEYRSVNNILKQAFMKVHLQRFLKSDKRIYRQIVQEFRARESRWHRGNNYQSTFPLLFFRKPFDTNIIRTYT